MIVCLGGTYLQNSTARLVDRFEIPLLQLRSIEDLPDTLHRFHRSFLQSGASQQNSARSQNARAMQRLLPYSGLSPPLREHTTNVLTDLTMGFANLANMTATDTGQLVLAEYLDQEEARRVILFWTHEHLP